MRITGGVLRGRRVTVPEGVIRPAMDRMRESVFACLGDLSGRSFLDLFSGSGVIALEASSRGASYIEAVEADPVKRKNLIQNAALSPAEFNCRFMVVELYVRRAKRPFDYIFCDPPFPYRFRRDLLAAIAASPLMTGSTTLLIHRPAKDDPGAVAGLIRTDSRVYGRSVVDFYGLTPV
jgi:16S rRNA (guanine(966)-N(2))-methyltransferase RsmD